MCVEVLLLANLAEKNADLVRKIRDGIVTSLLTPLGELGSDGDALFASGLVGADEVVLGLDKSEETASKVWLTCATERRKTEATVTASLVVVLSPAPGADRKRAVPRVGVSILLAW